MRESNRSEMENGTPQYSKMTLAFIGDSLTEAFDWQHRFPPHHILNLGISGEPIEGLINRVLEGCFSGVRPDMLFVMTGINNLRRGDHAIAERQERLLSVLHRLLPDTRIVIQSILPVTMWVPCAIIEALNTGLQKMAAEFSMAYLDLYPLFLTHDGLPDVACFEEDGIHLTPEGYRRWSGAVARFLEDQSLTSGV